ncbi:MAG: hypothetical protein ABI036_01960 [Fibrobacteria bacterium]
MAITQIALIPANFAANFIFPANISISFFSRASFSPRIIIAGMSSPGKQLETRLCKRGKIGRKPEYEVAREREGIFPQPTELHIFRA